MYDGMKQTDFTTCIQLLLIKSRCVKNIKLAHPDKWVPLVSVFWTPESAREEINLMEAKLMQY